MTNIWSHVYSYIFSMVNTKRVVLTIQNTSREPFEAHYAINKERLHLYIARTHEVVGSIHRAYFKEIESGLDGQLFDCYLSAFGEEYDEYIAKAALLGQSIDSYNENKYAIGIFTLSNDILRFFNSVWEIESHFEDRSRQVINFVSRENRKHHIKLNDESGLSIVRGYRQSYSKIRYEAHANAVFILEFNKGASREQILCLMQATADYYSLFCKKSIRIENIRFKVTEDHVVGYFGNPAGDGSQRDHFDNILIEQHDIDQYLDKLIVNWIYNYTKSEVCIGLIRDAEKISDGQLKFICYLRALELFHKEFFVNDDSCEKAYFDDLFDFVSVNNILEVNRREFAYTKMTLAHRLYDLVRYAYSIFSFRDFSIIFSRFINKGSIQKLVDTRNYLTHFSNKKKEKSWKQDELHFVNFSLFIMLRVLLLKKTGFTDKAIISVVRTFYRDYFGV